MICDAPINNSSSSSDEEESNANLQQGFTIKAHVVGALNHSRNSTNATSRSTATRHRSNQRSRWSTRSPESLRLVALATNAVRRPSIRPRRRQHSRRLVARRPHQSRTPSRAHRRQPSAPVAHTVCTSSAAVAEMSHELAHAVGAQETRRNRQGRRRLQSPRHADVLTICYTRQGLPFKTFLGILRESCWTSRTFYGIH
jgi:hypothetical protein